MGWTIRGSHSGKRFPAPVRTDHAYHVSFQGVKRPGRGVHYRLPPSAGVKERLELYVYFLYVLSRQVTGLTLPLPVTFHKPDR